MTNEYIQRGAEWLPLIDALRQAHKTLDTVAAEEGELMPVPNLLLQAADALSGALSRIEELEKVIQNFVSMEWVPSPTARGSTPRDTFRSIQQHFREKVVALTQGRQSDE